MQDALTAIVQAAAEPFNKAAVTTDNSYLLIHPPERGLDFTDMILDQCLPDLASRNTPYQILDLSGFLFSCFSDEELKNLESDEFRNYRLMRQGLSGRAEKRLETRIRNIAEEHPGTNLFLLSTNSLFPLVRYGEVLRNLRDLPLRIFVSFPGEERGGRPHFMNESDGGNYLAVKITVKS
ncbi:MAG: hypothetical protein NTW21_25335 [Verrucomicrobia bacterium]|nr:hypothetical protein [Verrucomicrobiota bacterium]